MVGTWQARAGVRIHRGEDVTKTKARAKARTKTKLIPVSVDWEKLRRAVLAARRFASRDDTRPHLASILLRSVDGELLVVACDGTRLVKVSLEAKGGPVDMMVEPGSFEGLLHPRFRKLDGCQINPKGRLTFAGGWTIPLAVHEPVDDTSEHSHQGDEERANSGQSCRKLHAFRSQAARECVFSDS